MIIIHQNDQEQIKLEQVLLKDESAKCKYYFSY